MTTYWYQISNMEGNTLSVNEILSNPLPIEIPYLLDFLEISARFLLSSNKTYSTISPPVFTSMSLKHEINSIFSARLVQM